MSAENLTLEELRQNPLIKKFASISPEVAALNPEGEKLRAFCISVIGGVEA